MPLCKYSGGELGISTSAAFQALHTIPNLSANQTYYQFLQGDVVQESVSAFENGRLSMLDGPGPGVTLDTDQLANSHEIYLREMLSK